MKLGELLEQLGTDYDEDDYEVKVETPMGVQEGGYSIKGVRWEHQSHEVILELGDD